MGSQVTSGNVSGEEVICGLSIKGCIGLQQERRKDKDVLNILFKLTGMRVSDPLEGWRADLDSEKQGRVGWAKGPDNKAPCEFALDSKICEWPLKVKGSMVT